MDLGQVKRAVFGGGTSFHEVGFWRGVTFAGVVFGLMLLLVMLPVSQRAHERVAVDREIRRMSGYSACCMDMMDILYHGGGVEELIMFSKVKVETCFSPMISTTNFYGDGR